jgi:general secretion pathway protein A
MYYEFFGVQRPPFNLTPDPSFLYMNPRHCEALAGISYAILARKGFVVLTGTAGTGKTTVLTRIMQHLPATRVRSSVILNPTLTPAEFLEAVMLDFGMEEIPQSKALRIVMLQKFLWANQRAGLISALVVDEAHKLTAELLEEIRLLGNFESATEKLLQIALLGQRELDDLLNSDQLQQFKQRIAQRITLEPLTASQVGEYIQHRWRVAGGKEIPFSAESIDCISQVTEGIPRRINVACDNALSDAFAEGSPIVEYRHVIDVCRDLQWPTPSLPVLGPTPASSVPPPPATTLVSNEYPMKTLERYNVDRTRPSLLARIRNKFRSPRTEIA